MTAAPTFPVEVLRDIQAQLSLPLFRGVPVGPAWAASVPSNYMKGMESGISPPVGRTAHEG